MLLNFILMEKLTLILIAFFFTFISCQKEDELINVQTDYQLKCASLRVWHDDGGTDFGCEGCGGSCLDDVIIWASFPNELFGVINSANEQLISAFFEENQDNLSEHVPPSIIENVINGVYFVTSRGTNLSEEGVYLLFSDKIGKLKKVVPFKES